MSEPRHVDKGDLIRLTAVQSGHAQSTAGEIINEFLNQIGQNLAQGAEVRIMGFGKFDRRWREPRQATNPQTGEQMLTRAKYLPKFTPGNSLKEQVN